MKGPQVLYMYLYIYTVTASGISSSMKPHDHLDPRMEVDFKMRFSPKL